MARTILITGASGFAGGHLIEALPADVRIVGWDRSLGATQDPRVTWRCVDLLDPRAVGEALAEAVQDEVPIVARARR